MLGPNKDSKCAYKGCEIPYTTIKLDSLVGYCHEHYLEAVRLFPPRDALREGNGEVR